MKYTNIYSNTESRSFDSGLRDYMYLIYKNMGIALFISAMIAFFVGNSPVLLGMLFSNPIIALIIALSPMFFVYSFTKSLLNLSINEAKNKLYIFSALMGLSLSTIFAVYTRQSIVETFLTTAITFGGMSLYGYTTKRDLTSLGSFLFMGIFGLCIASIINLFIRSAGFSYMLSCLGVVIFTLYTAFNVQKLKELYNYVGTSSDVAQKMAIYGALDLYITFVNLFTTLLHFLGDRRE
ncbi:MAG: Bax inhibitor-1/YccA family protein [Rickettsiales bacterium]|nr:Bax inhibitor-1/YccA family protein [Rickettsiales bacterium]